MDNNDEELTALQGKDDKGLIVFIDRTLQSEIKLKMMCTPLSIPPRQSPKLV